MSNKQRLGIFKVIATCPHCGNPVPVNGPQCKPICPSCLKKVEINTQTWKQILEEYLEDYDNLKPGDGNSSTIMGDLTLKCTSVKLPPPDPACPKCETNWNLIEIIDGMDSVITCKKCGHTAPTFPPPDWLHKNVDAVRQIFFADRDTGDATENTVNLNAESVKPIALACPQCNGGLLITAQTDRIMKCKYCNVDVFLPDALWKKLHPSKEAKYWLVRFSNGE